MRRSDAAVAGSEDQPGKKFPSCEFRVPGFELERTHFKTKFLRGGRMILISSLRVNTTTHLYPPRSTNVLDSGCRMNLGRRT